MAHSDPDIPAVSFPVVEKARKRERWRDALQPLPTIFDWYKANAVAGTLLAAAFLVVKGYVVARGNLTTALGVLQYAGLTSVVVAGVLSSLPILAAAMLYQTVRRVVWEHFDQKPERPSRELWLTFGGALVLSALLTPWSYLMIAVGLGWLTGRWPKIGKWPETPPGSRRRDHYRAFFAPVLFVLSGTFAVTAMLYTAWLPHEIVSFKAETQRPVVGYVLADDPGGWITILTSYRHLVVRYPDSTVKTQTVCQRIGSGWLADLYYASTPWEVATRSLGAASPAAYPRCKGG
jgi:hypothetical protein